MALTACPTAPTLVCGEMELNPQDGQAVPSLKAGDIISVGTVANSFVLSDAFTRQTRSTQEPIAFPQPVLL